MDIKTMLDIFGQYGLPIALVIYFVWRDYERDKANKREKEEMVQYIRKLETEMRTLLHELVSKTTQIIVTNSEALKDWMSLLKIRPCLADEIARSMLDKLMKDAEAAKNE